MNRVRTVRVVAKKKIESESLRQMREKQMMTGPSAIYRCGESTK
jgi:hypothetical protein